MIPWWWLIIAVFGGFLIGFFWYSMCKISADSDRLWQSYYQYLAEQNRKEEEDG